MTSAGTAGTVTRWHRKWLLEAPGVKSGFYSWAIRTGEHKAHAYRLGTRTVEGLCGYHFGKVVALPALDDHMCEACFTKAKSMEVELFGKSLESKVLINDPTGRYATQGPYGPLPRMGRKLRRLHSKEERARGRLSN